MIRNERNADVNDYVLHYNCGPCFRVEPAHGSRLVAGSRVVCCREQYGLLHAIRLFNGIVYKYKTDNVKTIVVHTVVIHFNRWQLKPPIR